MKKTILFAFTLLMTLTATAQTIRTNYRASGITHISTEYEDLQLDAIPAKVRVELAGFPDGSTLYLLYINLVQKTSSVVPKGVKMAATLNNGKLIRAEQIGEDSATKRRQDDGFFLNRLKYAIQPADMEKLVRGIKSVDIITGWNPDDYVQASFAENQLGDLLKRHCEAIRDAAGRTVELNATIASYTENLNSILSTTEPMVGRGATLDYNILLSHLYYKNNNEEDLDLAFVIGSKEQYHIPYDAAVRIMLNDGSVIGLLQTRDDVNFVYVYPTLEDLSRMANVGIKTLSIDYEGGILTDTFPAREDGAYTFSEAVNQELQLLLSMSPR
jgi:hypothetical protein